MEALAQQVAAKKRGGEASQGDRAGSPKKGRGGGKSSGKGKPKLDTTDAVLSTLVRDHLHMREDVSTLKAAANLLVIVLDNELKREISTAALTWTECKPGDDSAHPFGCGKRTVVFGAMLSIIGNMEGAGEGHRAAAANLKRLSPAQMDTMVATCKSRYNTYDEKKPWIFTLAVRPGVDQEQHKNVHGLAGLNVQKRLRVVHEAPRQSPETEALWAWIKTQSR